MRASIRRSASTSASAQSRSIVVVAGRMVRVRTAGRDEPAHQVLVRLSLFCLLAEPLEELTRRAAREGPESVQAAQLGKMFVPGCGSNRVVGELVPVHVELAPDEIHDGRRHELARSQQAARVAEHAQLQREAQLVAGASPGPDVLKVLVAQGVVAQQVRLALRQGEQGRPLPAGQERFSVPCSQSLDLQRDALETAGVDEVNVYHDLASGVRDDRPGLDSCLRALRKDDVLVVWKLDRLGRNLAHLVNTVQDLSARGVGLRVLAGDGAQIDTTTAAGRLVFGIFAALAEFERELIRERTVAGLEAARARGRKGGRKFALSKAQVRLAQAAMAHRDTSVSELCRELGIRPVTLYRYVGPQGQLREQGQKVLGS